MQQEMQRSLGLINNKKFENALNCIPQETPPIWLMRQAGRYHSHYQNLKKEHTFEELCKTPTLAAETALGPIRDFDFDVAILFSDILFPLQSLGLDLEYNPGPIFKEYLQPKHLNKKIDIDSIIDTLKFQSEALKETRKLLPDEKSLVGFVGGPWTLLSFGTGIKQEIEVKDIPHNKFYEELLYDVLIPVLNANIKMQFDSGAEIVYMFDTNAKQLDETYFLNTYVNKLHNELFKSFRNKIGYFSKNLSLNNLTNINENLSLAGYVHASPSTFITGIKNNNKGFIQGCFSSESLRKPFNDFLEDFEHYKSQLINLTVEERAGWICSLDHGVLPKTPEANVKYFINNIRFTFSK